MIKKWFALFFALMLPAIFAGCGLGGDDGISEEDLNRVLDERLGTPTAPAGSISTAEKIVQEYNSGKISSINALKVRLSDIGVPDSEIDDIVEDLSADDKTTGNDTAATETTSPTGGKGDGATETPTPEPTTTKTPEGKTMKGTGTKPTFVTDFTQGSWNVHGTDRLAENPIVDGWIKRLKDPAPAIWKTFPNIPNPDVSEFRVVNGDEVPDGVEYGTYDSPYCSSHPCDVPVGAWEYRLITGDYDVMGYECQGDSKTGSGCLLLLINVMDQSVTFRDQDVDNGFTVRGRYWNGDTLEWGVWGLVSHASANMLNMETFAHPGEVLNSGDPGNSGANCGIPAGCGNVDVRVIVVAGDAPIAVLETTVAKP